MRSKRKNSRWVYEANLFGWAARVPSHRVPGYAEREAGRTWTDIQNNREGNDSGSGPAGKFINTEVEMAWQQDQFHGHRGDLVPIVLAEGASQILVNTRDASMPPCLRIYSLALAMGVASGSCPVA